MSPAAPSTEPKAALRQRRGEQRASVSSSSSSSVTEEDAPKRDEVVWGKTPGGEGTWHDWLLSSASCLGCALSPLPMTVARGPPS